MYILLYKTGFCPCVRASVRPCVRPSKRPPIHQQTGKCKKGQRRVIERAAEKKFKLLHVYPVRIKKSKAFSKSKRCNPFAATK